ncbi:MAG: DUF1553 domain-containing protein [Verrucomicrobiales bacterium]|nr:DUF1553 domain-containing protein [Verrucomicrobiales bacterium]
MFHRLRTWVMALWVSWPAVAGSSETPRQSREHWAYQAVRSVPPPADAGGANPVDAFIRRSLARAGGIPAPEADRRTLIRRVTLDLTGLPPDPASVDLFVADPAPDAYERWVDRLLQSPAYGERWARHWMDAAHFAETHGHDQDRIRTNAWPYRDYLIASFNADVPYARFVREQIAGDVLFPGDPQATVALGFLAAGPWDESSLRDIREDTLDRQIGRYLDRDDMITTVMSVLASSTVHCARCHDHKFDPIPQADYYALQADFAGVDRANRLFDREPAVHRRRQELRKWQRGIESMDPAVLTGTEATEAVTRWERDRREHASTWVPIVPIEFTSEGGASLSRLPDDSLLAAGIRPERDTYSITATPPPGIVISAIRLDVLTDPSLPQGGPGRADNGNLHLSEFQFRITVPGTGSAEDMDFADVLADHNQESWTIQHSVDRVDTTAWGVHPEEGRSHHAIFILRKPLRPAPGARLEFKLQQRHGGGHEIGRLRLSVTDHASPVTDPPDRIATIISRSPSERTAEEQGTLTAWVFGNRVRSELATLPPPSRVYAAASDFEPDGGLKPSDRPRPVSILKRGEITQPTIAAEPGALACIPVLPARFAADQSPDEGRRRAALAEWLASDANPLTWRSVVNRVWALHFGSGLVATLNDFGSMGAQPSHADLLDWLAAWFRDDAHGSLKQLHRLLVTSGTYRQSCAPPESHSKAMETSDPDNRLYWRMNRTRQDAECVRDSILHFSGRLDRTMGGPSDRQFGLQPGIHVTPKVDYSVFDVDSAAGSRRSVYRFLFRTLPDPFMSALDCPAGDQITAARNNSVTVQQALALWNDRFVVRQAEHFAERLASVTETDRIVRACQCVWGRPPSPDERALLQRYADRHGMAGLCRLLLNSNEFLFIN